MGTPPTTGTVLKDRPDAPHAKQESLGRPSTVAEMRQNLVLLGCGVARMTRKQMFNLQSRHAGLIPAVELLYDQRVWLAPSLNQGTPATTRNHNPQDEPESGTRSTPKGFSCRICLRSSQPTSWHRSQASTCWTCVLRLEARPPTWRR